MDPAKPDTSEASVLRSAGRRPSAAPTKSATAATPSLPPLVVGVRHGSLEHAPYRLLLGHFQGLPLTSAEARLNERTDGRLERLLLMNLYPQRIGEMALLEPVDEAPPQGAVILGLGPGGELPAAQLRGVVTRALVRVALNELDRRLATGASAELIEHRPLGVSAVLIGSSAGGGLTIEASLRALIDGTLAANSRLARLPVRLPDGQHLATDVVRFGNLELIERYEDRVDLVVGVLARLDDLDRRSHEHDGSQPLEYVLKPALGEGRSSANPPVDAASDVWRRVDIRAAGPDAGTTVRLEFTSIGRLARAERVFGDVERAIVDQVVADAIHNPADDAVGGALFELLVPQELKAELGSGENLQLLVGPAEADLPWEMLRPRREDHEQQVPLALRVGLLRQFRETEELRFAARRASGNSVLVIGNPPSGDLPTLSGAAAEAQQVVQAFSQVSATSSEGDHGWTVKPIIWPGADDDTGIRRPTPKPADALYALLNGDWRVIHIAAHGEFGTNPAGTGVVLGSMHLTANVFSKLAVVPDLVVLNACHLGRAGAGTPLSGANRAAASVARALVRLGVRAVVVAGWAVDDRAASEFATQLYADMLAGADFGNAITSAREAAWSTASGALTWGAYQCYGDPGFRLSPRGAAQAGSLPTTKGELRRRVQLLQARASDQGRSAVSDGLQVSTRLREDLAELEGRAEALGAWDVMADLAGAWAEVLEFDRAIELYQAALQRGGSAVPLRAAEQIGNLQVREATRLHRAGDEERVAPYVEDAERWLSRALDLGESGERLALLGSFHKKRATMTDGAQRREHIDAAVTFYERANDVSSASYYELNVRQLAAVSRLDAPRAGLSDQATPQVESARPEPAPPVAGEDEGRPERAPDFWSRAERGDRLLTEALEVACDAPDQARLDEMTECYRAAFRLRSSARERASVVDHLDDLALLVPADHPLAERLRVAAQGLAAWPDTVPATTVKEETS